MLFRKHKQILWSSLDRKNGRILLGAVNLAMSKMLEHTRKQISSEICLTWKQAHGQKWGGVCGGSPTSFLPELLNYQSLLSSVKSQCSFKNHHRLIAKFFSIERDTFISTLCLWKGQHRKRKMEGKGELAC